MKARQARAAMIILFVCSSRTGQPYEMVVAVGAQPDEMVAAVGATVVTAMAVHAKAALLLQYCGHTRGPAARSSPASTCAR